MAKKQRISPIADFQINTDITVGNLPAPEQVNETIAVLTGKPIPAPAPAPSVIPVPEPLQTKDAAEVSVPEPIVESTAPAAEAVVVAQKVEKAERKKTAPLRVPKMPEPVSEPIREIRYGRPQKEAAAGRTKFTTMLQPDIVKQLKRQAIDRGETVADLLEHIISQHFKA